jgi:hypothetical protein
MFRGSNFFVQYTAIGNGTIFPFFKTRYPDVLFFNESINFISLEKNVLPRPCKLLFRSFKRENISTTKDNFSRDSFLLVYFQKMKVGLSNRQPVCVCVCVCQFCIMVMTLNHDLDHSKMAVCTSPINNF